MASPSNAEENVGGTAEGAGSPAPLSPPVTSGQSRIGKAPKVKPLKLGYLSFKEGNMLKKTFKPRFCILNKNNELEAYRDPNDQATGTKHALLSDLHVCDVFDIKDDKNEGFLFSLRINKTVHELCADTEQERTNWIVEILKLRPVPYLLGLLDDATLAYYAAFALGNLATHYDEARLRIVKEGGHLRLFNYLETSGKSDEGLHDMIYFAFSKMTALDENKEAMSMFITLFLQILNGSNERWKDFAIQALMHLSTVEANKVELKKQGGVKALLDVLSSDTTKDSWKEAAAAGLMSCASDTGVQLIIGEQVRGLASLLDHKNLKVALKNSVLSLLLSCVKNEKVFKLACDSPLIGSVLTLSEDPDAGVSEKAAALVALLSVDPQCRPRIMTQLHVVVQGLKSRNETHIEGHLLILLRVSADKQGCIELGRPERVLPLLQVLCSTDLGRTVRNYAASTVLNITAVEESRIVLGRDSAVLLAMLDAVNKLSSASGLDLSEKLLAALLRLAECDAVKLTLVRATGALNTVVTLLSAPIVNILTPVLGFIANCASHQCVRVELAASPTLEMLLRLLSFKTERVQELAAKVLAACAVPDAVVGSWKRVGVKEVVAVLTSKETSPKVQAVLCRLLASLAALGDLETLVVESGVVTELLPFLTSSSAELKENAARALRNVTSPAASKMLVKNIEKVIEIMGSAKNEAVEDALAQVFAGCVRSAEVSAEVLKSSVPALLALLQPVKGTRVVESAAMALSLIAASDDAAAGLMFNTGFAAITAAISTRNDRVQRHLTAALESCLKWDSVKATLKDKGALTERLLCYLSTGNLDVLENTLSSLRTLSVTSLKATLSSYVKRLASFLDFPSETVQDCIAGIIINTLIDDASSIQLSATAGLQAVTAAVRGAADATLTGSWSLSFTASPLGVPGKLAVAAVPPIHLSVSLATAEQRIGLARAIAKAFCPEEFRDSAEKRTRPSSAPEAIDSKNEGLLSDSLKPGETQRRLSAGQVRGSGIGSLWHSRQPRRLKPKKISPTKGDTPALQTSRFAQRQLNALAYYHALQDPRLTRRYPRLCAFIRESCPKEREPKEDLALSRRVPNQLEISKLSDLISVERDPYTISYMHSEAGAAAVVRAKRPLLEDVTFSYFEILVLDAGTNGTIALGLVSADYPANQMPGWKPLSWGYHGDDGNKYSNGTNTAYGPVFTTGDIVGCGVNNISGQIFFTKNGMLLGNAFDKGTLTDLYPAVGLGSPSERVYINLGQAPFAWDFETNADNTLAFTPAPKVDDSTPASKNDPVESPLVAAYEAHAGVFSWMCASPQLASALERNPSTIAAKFAIPPALVIPPPSDKLPSCNCCRLPVAGLLYVCSACDNFFACAECQTLGLHPPQHLVIAVHNYADDSCNSKFQPVRFKPSGSVHPGTVCDTCNMQPIAGVRYEKLDLSGFSKYDLCDSCHRLLPAQFDANFLQVPAPLERDVLPQQKVVPPTVTVTKS